MRADSQFWVFPESVANFRVSVLTVLISSLFPDFVAKKTAICFLSMKHFVQKMEEYAIADSPLIQVVEPRLLLQVICPIAGKSKPSLRKRNIGTPPKPPSSASPFAKSPDDLYQMSKPKLPPQKFFASYPRNRKISTGYSTAH
jgi:hypothetical protein